MGRAKTYDREEVANKAMDLFWRQGFHETTTQELVEQMGINRFSLFAEFGSKQGLFEAAMALYERDVVTHYFAAVEAPEAGLAEVTRVVKFFAASAGGPGSERGCFLCNTATERAPFDPSSKRFVDGYLARITKAFENALANAQRSGELEASAKVKDEARFLASMLLGFWVQMRAQADPLLVRGAARAAIAHLDRLRA